MSSVRRCFPIVQRFFRPQLGNGETFRFLQNDWLGHGRLCGAFPRLYSLSTEPGVSMRRARHDTYILLFVALTDQRVAELLRLQELLGDRRLVEVVLYMWVWNSSRFSARAAYRLLRDQDVPEDPLILQRCCLVWKRHLPLKIIVFAWLLARRRLMTRALWQRMAPNSPVKCTLCARAVEDRSHLFFICPLAQAVWQSANVGRLGMSSDEALWQSLGDGPFRHEVEWQTIFAILWSLWTYRNEVIFRGRIPSVDAIQHNARGFASFWHRGV